VPRVHIGKRLKVLREEAGMTQVAFAEALGIHWRNVQDWESDRAAVDTYKAESLFDAAEKLARNSRSRGKK